MHTGLPADCEAEEAAGLLLEAAAEFTIEAAKGGAEGLPSEVRGWAEALRFAHAELWPEAAAEQGTTALLEAEGALWVLARGAHELAILHEAGEGASTEVEEVPGGCRAWRLDPAARWRVEVSVAGGLGPLWSARWQPALALVAEPDEAVPADARSVLLAGAEPAPSRPPSRFGGLARRLTDPLRTPPRLLRRAAWAAAAVAALAVLWNVAPHRQLGAAWGRFGDLALGRYRVHVTTVPPGARLLVDGHDSGVRTPGWLLLHEGDHQVAADLGEYGRVAFGVAGGRGARAEKRAALLGRVAVGSADPTVALYAELDGRPAGRLPVLLDAVPAGRRLLSFQGTDVRPWTEEVGVVAGRTTQVLARPEKVPDVGVVVARAYRVGPEGLKDLPGAALYLDGKPTGVTPARLEVTRGLHTARLAADGVRSPVQLLRVEGGQEIYATAEFGRSPEPEVVDELLGVPSAAAPPTVRARLASQLPLRVASARLYLRRSGREFLRLPMTLRARGVAVVADLTLPLAGVAPGTAVSYFVSMESDEGEEFVSEMRTVKIAP